MKYRRKKKQLDYSLDQRMPALRSPTSTLSRLGWTVLPLTTVYFYRDEICLKTITGLPLLIFYNSLSYQQTPIMLISQGPCIMFSVNSALAKCAHRVLEETECTPRLFHEVPAYRGVRAKGANKGWQSTQWPAAVGSLVAPKSTGTRGEQR